MSSPDPGERVRPCVVIIAHKKAPDAFETVSLQQCARIFKRFDTILVHPVCNDIEPFREVHPGLISTRVPDIALASYAAFNKLKVDCSFYDRFAGYTHLLFYELDAFAFRDELEQWCGAPIDYVGAPWLEMVDGVCAVSGIGNGGFSLRKLSAVISVLKSNQRLYQRLEIFAKRHVEPTLLRYLSRPGHLIEWLFANQFNQCPVIFDGPEDLFWGRFVRRSFPHFRYPTDEQAISFAFEHDPRGLFARNHQRLPFGCHAWWTYDFEFWRPHIEACGYSLPRELPSPSTSFRMSRPQFTATT